MSGGESRRILVVDDDQATQAEFRALLGACSQRARANPRVDAEPACACPGQPCAAYEVDCVSEGSEALERVREAHAQGRPYALAFVDLRPPPQWSGMETIARLHEADAALHLVACSAHQACPLERLNAALGTTDRLLMLRKPLDRAMVGQFAAALTGRWSNAVRERARLAQAERAGSEAEAYVASLQTMHRAMEASQAATLTALRSRSECLTNMSEEAGVPVAAILAAVGQLRQAGVGAGLEAPLDRIEGEAVHLQAMFADVLELAAIEAGRLVLDVQPCSLRLILAELETAHRPRAREKGLDLRFEIAPSVPATLSSDPNRLRQILDLLLANAVRFTERGSVGVRAAIEGGSGSTQLLRIEVEDTGIGFTPEQRLDLFEAFTGAAGGAEHRRRGSGLGLALSRSLALLLGAELDVTSTPGSGTRFSLSFEAIQSQEPAGGTARSGSDGRTELRGRILLVEDVPATQRLYAHFLRRAGADVDVASDGQACLDLAHAARTEGRPYDLILLDMQMPGIDGYSAVTRLRQRGHREPVVAVTAHSVADEREHCLRAGCDDFCAKPVRREDLVRVSREWIQRGVAPALPARGVEEGAEVAAESASTGQHRWPGRD